MEERRVTKYTRKNAPYGKGDSRRQGADDEAYRRGWERIFGKCESIFHCGLLIGTRKSPCIHCRD